MLVEYQKMISLLYLTVEPAVSITVTPQPDTSILPNLFRIGQQYTLNCSATGNPTPSVHWEWYRCTSTDGKNCQPPEEDSSWKVVSMEEPGSSENAGVKLIQQVSNVFIQEVKSARLAGHYRCVADSPKFDKRAVKIQDFLVTGRTHSRILYG